MDKEPKFAKEKGDELAPVGLKMDQKGQKWITWGYNEPKSTFIVLAIFGP